jgi:hypothetical protein
MTCNCTLGFTGSGDISIVSVLPSHLCVVGQGIQLTALLYNLSCPQPQPGQVGFYWVPLGWTPQSNFQPVKTPDAQTGDNVAQAIDNNGGLNISPSQAVPATLCWAPTTTQIGVALRTKGTILAQPISQDNGQGCGPCTPPLDLTCCVLSGSFPIYSSDSLAAFHPTSYLVERTSPRDACGSRFAYMGFVVPNLSKEKVRIDIVGRSIGTNGPSKGLPPVLPGDAPEVPEPFRRNAVGSARLVRAPVRLGLGRQRAHAGSPGFMAHLASGLLDFGMFRELLGHEPLSEQKQAHLEPGEIAQGLAEIEFPDRGSAPAVCLLDVAYNSEGQRVGGFHMAVSSDGAIL